MGQEQPVTAILIKELRERTGVGMGKCKEALEEAKGDIDLAIANLRKAGMASAVKKEGRSTNEGVIAFAEGAHAFGIVEVNAETDFSVRNERFQQFVALVSQEIAKTQPASLEQFMQQPVQHEGHSLTVDEFRTSLIQAIGENIQVKRLHVFPKKNDKSIGIYSHLGGKIVTVAEITGSAGEEALAKEIAMHIAAAAPEFLSPECVPADVIAGEREIAMSQLKDKPANILEKIVDGKLDAYYGTVCLTKQKFIKDDQLTIAELVEKRAKEIGKPLSLTGFARWSLNQI